jgi:hypothetical protein
VFSPPKNKPNGPLQGLQNFSSPFLPNVSAGAQAGEGFDPFMGSGWGRYLDTLSGKEGGGPPMNVAIQGLESLNMSPGIHAAEPSKLAPPKPAPVATTPKPRTAAGNNLNGRADWYNNPLQRKMR